jgi:hypothetical protein
MTQDLRRVRERQVRNHTERLVRPAVLARVDSNDSDARKSPAQARCVLDVELDGDHAARVRDQLSRYDAVAGSDLDDQITAGYSRVADEISGKPRSKEVPTAWTDA